jgi:hypothetical protein
MTEKELAAWFTHVYDQKTKYSHSDTGAERILGQSSFLTPHK